MLTVAGASNIDDILTEGSIICDKSACGQGKEVTPPRAISEAPSAERRVTVKSEREGVGVERGKPERKKCLQFHAPRSLIWLQGRKCTVAAPVGGTIGVGGGASTKRSPQMQRRVVGS